MQHKKNISDYCTRIIIMVCVVFFAYIMLSFVAQNICYEILGMTNPIVDYFVKDDLAELNEEGAAESVSIDWSIQYPFEGTDRSEETKLFSVMDMYLSVIETVKTKVDMYANDVLPYKKEMVRLSSVFKEIIGYDLQLSEDKSDLIYMQNGYLTYPQPKVQEEDIEEIANSLAEFNEYLSEMEIPFLYINTGSKVCPTDKQMNVECIEYTNENADALQVALQERNVNYLDFRTEMAMAGLDWYDSYYITDHHWTTETGLWAAKVIAETLNLEYGYSFDTELFELSKYYQTVYDDFWIGGQGRIDAFAKSELESFTLLLPKYETVFSIKIPTREINLSGEYKETLIDMEVLERVKNYSQDDFLTKPDAYHCSQLRNDALATIENHLQTNNEGKKILFIQDSFAWYSTTFLATDVSQIDVLYPMQFDGSIKAYIEETRPDMVIMMYCERQIEEIDWTTHLDAFDLR